MEKSLVIQRDNNQCHVNMLPFIPTFLFSGMGFEKKK